MFHGSDLNAQRNLCGSGDLNAQRIFRGNGDLKVFEGQRKCDLVKLGRLRQDLVKLVLLRWREQSFFRARIWDLEGHFLEIYLLKKLSISEHSAGYTPITSIFGGGSHLVKYFPQELTKSIIWQAIIKRTLPKITF